MADNRLIRLLNLSKEAFWQYRGRITILASLGFLSGLLEGIGVNALVPLLSFLSGESGNELDFISRLIKDFFGFLNIDFSLVYLLVFICALFVLKSAVLFVFNYIKISIQSGYEKEMRERLFRDTLKAEWSYLLKQKLGYLETVLMTDIQYSASFLEIIAGSVMNLSGLLMYLLVAINISWNITLLTLSVGGLIFLVLKPLMYKSRILAGQTAVFNKDVSQLVNESVIGMKTIKSMLAENTVIKIGKGLFESLQRNRIKASLLKSVSVSLLQPVTVMLISSVFIFSYYTASFHFAVLIAIVYLIQRIFSYTQMLQSNFHNINELSPYLSTALHYRKQAIHYKEKEEGGKKFKLDSYLQFRDVVFSYRRNRRILDELNFKIKKGEMVGLIGFSGAGKTTIVDLILRLFRPVSGDILLDGTSIQKIDLKEWRGNIGYVSQDLFLINDSIINNIRFYNDSISDEDVYEASRMAFINDFIETLPEKYETVIGERGIFLSAGQRQRIVIARVLARKPKILLLDEATSALDNESEMEIQKAIEKLKGQITILVIAHRLSTVMNSDKLIVLESGKVAEEGEPKDLLKNKDSYFYKIYNLKK